MRGGRPSRGLPASGTGELLPLIGASAAAAVFRGFGCGDGRGSLRALQCLRRLSGGDRGAAAVTDAPCAIPTRRLRPSTRCMRASRARHRETPLGPPLYQRGSAALTRTARAWGPGRLAEGASVTATAPRRPCRERRGYCGARSEPPRSPRPCASSPRLRKGPRRADALGVPPLCAPASASWVASRGGQCRRTTSTLQTSLARELIVKRSRRPSVANSGRLD